MKTFLLAFLYVLFNYSICIAQDITKEYRKNYFELGLGLNGSNDYKDVLLEELSGAKEISGGFTWIDIEAGLGFNISNKFYLIPRFQFLVHRIERQLEGFEFAPNRSTNSIFILGLSGNYNPLNKFPDFYVSLDLGFIKPSIDLSDYSVDSNGPSLGFGLGYSFLKDQYGFEIGYLRIPVEVKEENSYYNSYYNSNDQTTGNKQFGGMYIKIKRKFYL